MSPQYGISRPQGISRFLGITVWFGMIGSAFLCVWLFDDAVQAALFIPDKLGLVERPGPETKVSVIIPGQEEVHFSWAGTYQVYRNTTEYNDYKIYLMSLASNRPVEIEPLPRLDTPDDLPLFEFEIEEPGDYLINVAYIRGPADGREVLTILPTVANQNAAVAVLAGICQGAILLAAVWGIYYRLWGRKIRAEVTARKAAWENWLAEK